MELEVKIRGLMMDPVTNMPVVVLKETSGSGVLPDLGGNLRSQRHRAGNRKSTDAAAHDARPAEKCSDWPRRAGAARGGLRSEGRYFLRFDLDGARRADHFA